MQTHLLDTEERVCLEVPGQVHLAGHAVTKVTNLHPLEVHLVTHLGDLQFVLKMKKTRLVLNNLIM